MNGLLQTFLINYDLVVSGKHMVNLFPFFANAIGEGILTYKTDFSRYVGVSRNDHECVEFDDVLEAPTESYIPHQQFNPRWREALPIIQKFLLKHDEKLGLTFGLMIGCKDGDGFGSLIFEATGISVCCHLLAGKVSMKQMESGNMPEAIKKSMIHLATEIHQACALYKTRSGYISQMFLDEPGLFLQEGSQCASRDIKGSLDIVILNLGSPTQRALSYAIYELFVDSVPDIEGVVFGVKQMHLDVCKEFFLRPYDEKKQEEILNMYQQRSHLVQLIEGESTAIRRLLELFDSIKLSPEEKIAIVPYTSTRLGASVICFFKGGVSRRSIERLIVASKDLYPDSACTWKSRESIQGGSISITQRISHEKYSELLPQGTVIARSLHGEVRVGSYDEVYSELKNAVLLDAVTGKVSIKNQFLTSKEINSQSYTIELFSLLVSRSGKSVLNKEFPIGSYSTSKNQMYEKIIKPLQQVVESIYGSALEITSVGGLYEYTLQLTPSAIDVWCIEYVR